MDSPQAERRNPIKWREDRETATEIRRDGRNALRALSKADRGGRRNKNDSPGKHETKDRLAARRQGKLISPQINRFLEDV